MKEASRLRVSSTYVRTCGTIRAHKFADTARAACLLALATYTVLFRGGARGADECLCYRLYIWHINKHKQIKNKQLIG